MTFFTFQTYKTHSRWTLTEMHLRLGENRASLKLDQVCPKTTRSHICDTKICAIFCPWIARESKCHSCCRLVKGCKAFYMVFNAVGMPITRLQWAGQPGCLSYWPFRHQEGGQRSFAGTNPRPNTWYNTMIHCWTNPPNTVQNHIPHISTIVKHAMQYKMPEHPAN